MNKIAIKTDLLSKFYSRGSEKIKAVNEVSIEIKKGEMVAVIGRSGAGKTTLLSCMGLLEGFDSGKLFIDGIDMTGTTESKRTKLRLKHLGFIFQRFYLLPTMNSFENISIPFLFSGRKAQKRRIDELLEMVGLTERKLHRPYELSGGEMQRVAVARALALDPDIIIADEPTGNLDSGNANRIFSLLKNLANNGKTIIIATHSGELAGSCDRIIEMLDGKVVNS
ncbi:MAG: ABC transporter ATP-binding protein [Caldisericia bacterium]